MRAAIYEEFQGPVSVRIVDDPAPSAAGAVLRVEATGVCRSDWHGWMGHDKDITLPHVPGMSWRESSRQSDRTFPAGRQAIG